MTKRKIQPQVIKKVEKITGTFVKKDSAEIDDLFDILSKSKKSKTISERNPELVSLTETNTLLKSLDQKDEEYSDVFESATEDESSHTEIFKGTPYNPSRDDFVPTLQNIDSDFFDSRGLRRKTRALTEDGLPIFTPKELKIGLGGGTDLCPFDCNCCF